MFRALGFIRPLVLLEELINFTCRRKILEDIRVRTQHFDELFVSCSFGRL